MGFISNIRREFHRRHCECQGAASHVSVEVFCRYVGGYHHTGVAHFRGWGSCGAELINEAVATKQEYVSSSDLALNAVHPIARARFTSFLEAGFVRKGTVLQGANFTLPETQPVPSTESHEEHAQ